MIWHSVTSGTIKNSREIKKSYYETKLTLIQDLESERKLLVQLVIVPRSQED